MTPPVSFGGHGTRRPRRSPANGLAEAQYGDVRADPAALCFLLQPSLWLADGLAVEVERPPMHGNHEAPVEILEEPDGFLGIEMVGVMEALVVVPPDRQKREIEGPEAPDLLEGRGVAGVAREEEASGAARENP